jgi:uncharacterized paraquat-inducible protein A
MSTTITKHCGHRFHVGTCANCQRELHARHDEQLQKASAYGAAHPSLPRARDPFPQVSSSR